MKKLTMKATIPVVQYGNIMPEIELEGENLEDLNVEALSYIQKLWDQYGEKPLVKNEVGEFEKLTTFTNEVVFFDKINHTYKDGEGNVLISGSQFKKLFEKPFPADIIIPKVASKYKVEEQVIKDMWKANGRISTTFGNAIHYAMEQYFKYKESKCEDKDYNVSNHPFLKKVVESFPDLDKDIVPELLVSDIDKKRVGQIDGMIITGDKTGTLLDYKSDGDIEKNLDGHFIQLSFYAHILMAHGWNITGLTVYNYVDKWYEYERAVVDIDKLLKEKK